MESKFKPLYESLLESGELFESMTGDWEVDKKAFAQIQQDMEDASKDLKITIEDLYEEDEDIEELI